MATLFLLYSISLCIAYVNCQLRALKISEVQPAGLVMIGVIITNKYMMSSIDTLVACIILGTWSILLSCNILTYKRHMTCYKYWIYMDGLLFHTRRIIYISLIYWRRIMVILYILFLFDWFIRWIVWHYDIYIIALLVYKNIKLDVSPLATLCISWLSAVLVLCIVPGDNETFIILSWVIYQSNWMNIYYIYTYYSTLLFTSCCFISQSDPIGLSPVQSYYVAVLQVPVIPACPVGFLSLLLEQFITFIIYIYIIIYYFYIYILRNIDLDTLHRFNMINKFLSKFYYILLSIGYNNYQLRAITISEVLPDRLKICMIYIIYKCTCAWVSLGTCSILLSCTLLVYQSNINYYMYWILQNILSLDVSITSILSDYAILVTNPLVLHGHYLHQKYIILINNHWLSTVLVIYMVPGDNETFILLSWVTYIIITWMIAESSADTITTIKTTITNCCSCKSLDPIIFSCPLSPYYGTLGSIYTIQLSKSLDQISLVNNIQHQVLLTLLLWQIHIYHINYMLYHLHNCCFLQQSSQHLEIFQ